MKLPRPSSLWPTVERAPIPAACAGALLLCLVLQLALPITVTLPEAEPRPMRGVRLASPRIAPVGVPADLLAAPFFSPTRRQSGASTAGSEGVSLALVGTAGSRNGPIAVIRDSTGATVLMRPGQRRAGWRLDGVSRDRAYFTSAQGRHVLSIGEAPASSAGADEADEQP